MAPRLTESVRDLEECYGTKFADTKRSAAGSGMGGTDWRMPQQWQECPSVVQGKGDIGEDVLLLAEKAVPADGVHSRRGRVCRDTPRDTNRPELQRSSKSMPVRSNDRGRSWGRCTDDPGDTRNLEAMLNDFGCSCPVYIACGYTDLRRGIDGLASMVQEQFEMDPFQRVMFLFCGQRRDCQRR